MPFVEITLNIYFFLIIAKGKFLDSGGIFNVPK